MSVLSKALTMANDTIAEWIPFVPSLISILVGVVTSYVGYKASATRFSKVYATKL